MRRLHVDTKPSLLPPSIRRDSTAPSKPARTASAVPSQPVRARATPAVEPTSTPATAGASASAGPAEDSDVGSSAGPAGDGDDALTRARVSGVWVAGDSVMVGALRTMRKRLPVVRNDAEVGMQANVLFHTLRDATGDVQAQTVVLNIGNNGTVREKTLRRILGALGGRTAVLVDAAVPRRWESANNRLVRDVAADFPNVRVVQWSRISDGHPEYFAHDGIHLTASGATRYVAAIVEALAAK